MPAWPVTVVGGPSWVPAIVPAASTIVSFKPSGVTYTKAPVPSLAQAFSSKTGSPGLFTYKQALMTRCTPPIQRDPAVAQQEALVAPAPDVVSNDQSSLYETWQSLHNHIQDMPNPQ